MRTPARLAAYGLAVATAFAGAWGIGQAVGEPPTEPAPEPMTEHGEDADHGTTTGHDEEDTAMDGHDGHEADATGALPDSTSAGLQISQDGYTFHLMQTPTTVGAEATLAFHILGPDGDPVTEFDIAHEQPLHLIVANRSLTAFQHVHPAMDADGLWTIPLTLESGGAYRAFADFAPTGGDPLTLGADVLVAGDATPAPLPEPAPTASVDGYEVALNGTLTAGSGEELTFTVTRDGRPVELEPYLGAYGHLVVLRAGDLAYLHAHPEGAEPEPGRTGGAKVGFHTTAPSVGAYRLFLDFQVDGVVHTAAFTVEAGSTTGTGHQH